MIAADPRSEMLFEMGQCAYRLGKGFGEAAERAEVFERKLEYFQLFDRCFFAARMSVALELRLRREARAEGRAHADTRDHEAADRDPVERDPPETETYTETEFERERDREPVSLPVLLRTLKGVADDAAALPGPEPAALPTLRELLARVTSAPVAAPRTQTAQGALRTRLAGSGAAQVLVRPPPGAPRPSGRGPPRHRATGPPRR